jgi:molecular chaperone HtpG
MSGPIPQDLRDLLKDSDFESSILGLANSCERILADNQMPFFPAYTDHGIAHVTAVMDAAVKLVPGQAWEEELLRPEDAGPDRRLLPA